MREKLPLARLLDEIIQDEQGEEAPLRQQQVSQDEIRKLVAQQKKRKPKGATP